jgi:UDP-N-acetylbacillosamine N-acetyltransferase
VTDILVLGAGGHARVVIDIIRLLGGYRVVGFLDEIHPDRYGTAYEGGTILGGADLLAELGARVKHAVVAIGDNEARMRLAAAALQHGYQLPVLIHPAAVIASSVDIGAGSVVGAGAVINPATSVGANVIINTGATIDHDCAIEEGVHIGPGVHIGGHVKVGRAALFGVGSAVRPWTSIGAGATVGVGAAVVADVPAGCTVAGVPARVLP